MVEGQKHLVCRSRHQWESIVPRHLADIGLQNARNGTLPKKDTVDTLLVEFSDSVTETFPLHCIKEGTPHSEALQEWGRSSIVQEQNSHGKRFPEITMDKIAQLSSRLKRLKLCAGVWDKEPTSVFAMCPVPAEIHQISGILNNPEFGVRAISSSRKHANACTLAIILDSASSHGILTLGNKLGLLPLKWGLKTCRDKVVLESCGDRKSVV